MVRGVTVHPCLRWVTRTLLLFVEPVISPSSVSVVLLSLDSSVLIKVTLLRPGGHSFGPLRKTFRRWTLLSTVVTVLLRSREEELGDAAREGLSEEVPWVREVPENPDPVDDDVGDRPREQPPGEVHRDVEEVVPSHRSSQHFVGVAGQGCPPVFRRSLQFPVQPLCERYLGEFREEEERGGP